MNYRHAYHAGNFADLVKHAGLTLILDALTSGPPLMVIDTHAGAGAYDLAAPMPLKSGEAAIARLALDKDAPEAFDILLAAVHRANPDGGFRIYPGSPALVCAALRADDRLSACELRADDHAELAALLTPFGAQARAVRADGFDFAAAHAPSSGPLLVLIDPPYERSDDYPRAARAAAAVLTRNPAAVIAIWTPLKDLETFDGFLRALEPLRAPVLVAEARLHPLHDPMRMNGCALVVANPTSGLEGLMREICTWVASRLGGAGNEARVWLL